MNINELTTDEIEELAGLSEIDKNFLKTRKNGLLLTDNQVSLLERYNIDSEKCTSMTELMYLIDEAGEDDDELDYLAEQLAERNYYENVNK